MAQGTRTSPLAGRDVAIVTGLALGGISVLLLTPVAAPTTTQRGLAWVALVALIVAALWLPLRRFRSWTGEDRRAAVRSVGRAAPAAIGLAYVASALGAAATVLALGPDRGFMLESWAMPLVPTALPFLVPATAALLFALRPVTPLAAAQWAVRKGLAHPDSGLGHPRAAATADVAHRACRARGGDRGRPVDGISALVRRARPRAGG